MTPPEKQPFLVAYDYGMGGLWAFLHARSVEDIRERYPELDVVSRPPDWMTGDGLARLQRHDIDEDPSGILKAVIRDRRRDADGADA